MNNPLALFPLLPLAFFLTTACDITSTVPPSQDSASPQPAGSEQAGSEKAKPEQATKKAADPAKTEKQLRELRQQLGYAEVAFKAAEIDGQIRLLGAKAGLGKAKFARNKAGKELTLYLQEQKPRWLEQRRMRLEAQTNRAEETKEELAELEGMYKEDQHAASTKELVIKRGRRAVKMAARTLALGRQEFKVFEQHTLPDGLKALERKVRDADLDVKKAELQSEKARIDSRLKQTQAADKIHNLRRDIADLQKKLEKKS